MTSKPSFFEAVEDLLYLLSRGYNFESFIRFVGDSFHLNRQHRLKLYRARAPLIVEAFIKNLFGILLGFKSINSLLSLGEGIINSFPPKRTPLLTWA